jgi:hypothetical protein
MCPLLERTVLDFGSVSSVLSLFSKIRQEVLFLEKIISFLRKLSSFLLKNWSKALFHKKKIEDFFLLNRSKVWKNREKMETFFEIFSLNLMSSFDLWKKWQRYIPKEICRGKSRKGSN